MAIVALYKLESEWKKISFNGLKLAAKYFDIHLLQEKIGKLIINSGNVTGRLL